MDTIINSLLLLTLALAMFMFVLTFLPKKTLNASESNDYSAGGKAFVGGKRPPSKQTEAYRAGFRTTQSVLDYLKKNNKTGKFEPSDTKLYLNLYIDHETRSLGVLSFKVSGDCCLEEEDLLNITRKYVDNLNLVTTTERPLYFTPMIDTCKYLA